MFLVPEPFTKEAAYSYWLWEEPMFPFCDGTPYNQLDASKSCAVLVVSPQIE